MKVKKVLSTVVFLSMVLLLMNGLANKASPQNINLISSSINDAFKILWENREQAKDNSVTADVVISNLTGTWFQVELEFNPSQHNVVVGEDKIPYVFLMGPYQKKIFKDIEFFDMQVLQFDARRDVEEVPAVYLVLCIDMICRGLFGEPLTIDNLDQIRNSMTIEDIKAIGDNLRNDSWGPFAALCYALSVRDFDEAAKSFAEFVISTKKFKEQIIRIVKIARGEAASVTYAEQILKRIDLFLGAIDFPKKVDLLESLYYDALVSPTDDRFWLTAKSNVSKLPQVKLASPLRLTPNKSTYYVGDVITAAFGLDNDGSKAIALRQVLVGGRGPGGEQDIQDFSPRTNVFLGLNTCYQYQGTLKLTKPGKYHFFCVYQTQDGQWNSSIDLGPGLNNADRIRDIIVVSNVVMPDNRISWEFNTPRNFDGWSVEGASDKAVDFEGHLVINPDRDPRVYSPLVSIDSRLYNAVMFRMVSYADNQQGQIYFNRGTGDYNEIDTAYFTVYTTQRNRVPEWRDYLIYFGDKPGWTGTIKGIRIDPASDGNFDGSYDDIAIDWIRLVKFTDLSENSLVQATGNDKVYLFQKGKLWPFSNSQMFEVLGYKWSDVAFYSAEALNRYALGPTIIAEGSLIRKNGDDKVYLIENGKMRWIASPSIFQQRGFKDDDIYVVSYQGWNFVNDLYPFGLDITIAPSVIVSYPNGWESWQAGSQRNIVWSANDDVGVGSISLYYSTNGGASWTWITSGEPNNGVYSWQIPDISSTLCKIKVVAYDYSGMAGEDISDNNFTIISKPRINIRPVVTIISGPIGITDNNAPIFTWAGSDSDGSVVGYHYSIDNSAPNRWTTSTYYACEALNNGNHAFYLSAQDDDGALSDVASQSFTVNVITVVADISPPILTISQPLFNGQIFTTQNITVAGTAFDESGIQRVVVNGETAFGTTTWTRDISLVKGFNFITVIVYDNSPNRNSKIGGLAVIYVTQTEISPEPSIVGMVYVATIGDDSAGKGSKARPYRTIQKGINTAINGSIILVSDGVYTGPGNVNLSFEGKAIIVRSENGASRCVIDCEGRDNTRGFYFHNSESSDSVLDGFTIRNGKILSDTWEYSSGGGIYCLSSSPTIKNNVITQNRAKSGGGILCDKSSAVIENNTIIKNVADDCGGGIACGNTPSPKIQSNIIKMNEAKSGGGINCNTSSPMITNNLIEGNSAIDGGAIRCWDRSYPKIVNSNILGNWASFGGGIRIGKESSVEIINTILWWNWNTRVNNHEQISLNGFSGYDRNTVIISYSDVMNGQAGIITGNNNTNMINWGQGNIDLYPMFADAVNRDYHLSDNSPCLGAGIMASGVPSVDIEGNLRPNPSWSRPDMGMYESMLRSAMLGPDKMNKSDWLTNFKTESFQNYPNPFNPETWIPYQLSESGNVVVGIYDVSGRLVQKLDLGYKEAGRYVSRDKAAYWDGRNDVGELVPSGVYFYNIQAGAFTVTKKMIIQK